MKKLMLSLFFVAACFSTASAQNAFLTDLSQNQFADEYSLNSAAEPVTGAYFQTAGTSGDDASGWNVAFTPYLWIAGQSGDVVVRGFTVSEFDVSFGDVLEDLDMAFAGHLEATKDNKWTLLFDINYVNISDSPNVAIVRLKTATTEIGATYHINDSFEFLGGARIVRYKLEVTPGNNVTLEDSKTFLDGFAGIRASAKVGKSSTVSARGDIGGLASDFSWNIILDGSMRFADWGSFYLAYRWWEIDYGSNDDNDFQVMF